MSTLGEECPFHCPSLYETWDKATVQSTRQKAEENSCCRGS